eukprot:1321233-Lingulodinium_polyedra.AAC.1
MGQLFNPPVDQSIERINRSVHQSVNHPAKPNKQSVAKRANHNNPNNQAILSQQPFNNPEYAFNHHN